jgi:hypothetical protein
MTPSGFALEEHDGLVSVTSQTQFVVPVIAASPVDILWFVIQIESTYAVRACLSITRMRVDRQMRKPPIAHALRVNFVKREFDFVM